MILSFQTFSQGVETIKVSVHKLKVNSNSKCTTQINSGHDRRSGNVRKNNQPYNQKEPIMGLFGILFIFLIKGKD